MPYVLGVDLGSTATSVVLLRPDAPAEPVALGQGSSTVPTTLFIGPDGTTLFGAAAEARGLDEPNRTVRHFLPRVGDDVPLIAGPAAGRPHGNRAHELAAAFVGWVVAAVTEREGAAPETVALTVPETWGPYKRDLLRTAVAAQGLGPVVLVGNVDAAVRACAKVRGLPAGATVAVCDFGGTTFTAAVARTRADGSARTLAVRTLPGLGGADVDDAVLAHLLTVAPPAVRAQLHAADDAAAVAGARLRSACVRAKEELSTASAAVVEIRTEGRRTRVRLVRAELESLVAARLAGTGDALADVLAEAGLAPTDLSCVLACGGSAAMPMVAQVLSARLGPEVALERDTDPALSVAVGAAVAAGSARSTRTGPGTGRTETAGGAATDARRPQVAPPAPAAAPVAGAATPRRPVAGRLVAGPPAAGPRSPRPATSAPVEPVEPVEPVVATKAVRIPQRPVGAAVAADAGRPILDRRGRRRAEIVGLEAARGRRDRNPAADRSPVVTIDAVIPGRPVAGLANLLTVAPPAPAPVPAAEPALLAPVRGERPTADLAELIPPQRPAVEGVTFDTDDPRRSAEPERRPARPVRPVYHWRSLCTARRVLAIAAITVGVFLGSNAWVQATSPVTESGAAEQSATAAGADGSSAKATPRGGTSHRNR